MADKQITYLTAEGAAKLEAELQDLKGPQREAISRRLRLRLDDDHLGVPHHAHLIVKHTVVLKFTNLIELMGK